MVLSELQLYIREVNIKWECFSETKVFEFFYQLAGRNQDQIRETLKLCTFQFQKNILIFNFFSLNWLTFQWQTKISLIGQPNLYPITHMGDEFPLFLHVT